MEISVITATYNCAATILDCLSSVTAQTHTEREHIVIDGMSTDGTIETVKAHDKQVDVLIREPDRGIYDALNKGIARAKGEVIGFLHADDFYPHKDVLTWIAHAFEYPQVQAIYGDLRYVSGSDPSRVVRNWRAGPYAPHRLAWGWMPPHPTFYVRREVYEQHGAFDTTYQIAADYDCMLRLLTRLDGRVFYIPKTLVHMRTGGISNRSLHNILIKSSEDLRALRRNKVGGARALLWKNFSKLSQFLDGG